MGHLSEELAFFKAPLYLEYHVSSCEMTRVLEEVLKKGEIGLDSRM